MPNHYVRALRIFTLGLITTALACGPRHGPPPSSAARPVNERAPTADEPTARGRAKHLPQDAGTGPADQAERAQLVAQLWLTPLGKMFRHFLYETDPEHSPAELSHQIIDRIHGNVRMTLTRTTALSLMIEDLYNTSELTPTSHDRIALLSMGLAVKRDVLQNTSSKEYLKFLPLFLATGLAAGSPLIRGKVGAIGNDLWALTKGVFTRGSSSAARAALRADVRLGEVFSRKVLAGYSAVPAYLAFQHAFTTGYLVYYVARTGSADAVAVQNKIWVYGMQRFVDFDEI